MILAALFLCKIGDACKIYAVKRTAIYDESERVKKHYLLLYKATIAGEVYVSTMLERL